ncbi:MAG: peptidase S41 [Chloroflexaceae bacterium]|nr:peptidase S41 [Chloroflexaceae bacterium]
MSNDTSVQQLSRDAKRIHPPENGLPYLRTPTVAPDGRSLAFMYAYDIWLVGIDGGTAERLTGHPASHTAPRFSPDGTRLAFTTSRSGRGDVYVLPLTGGAAQRITYTDAYSITQDWSVDGQHIYYTSSYQQQGRMIYQAALAGATPVLLYGEPYEDMGYVAAAPDGTRLAFATLRRPWWRRGPDPFGPSDIWLAPATPPPAANAERHPIQKLIGSGTAAPYTGLNVWPLWSADGQQLYFVSDRNDGIENIWCYELESGTVRQITHFRDGRVLWPAIACNAPVIVFERHGTAPDDPHSYRTDLWRLDLTTEAAAPIPIVVRTDPKFTPVYVEGRSRGFSEYALSGDGKKIAYVSRGNIFADFADKDTDRERRQGDSFPVTGGPSREMGIEWSRESRGIIYLSDRHGENEMYAYDFQSRTEYRLTNDSAPKYAPRLSPDGKWVAYIRGHNELYLFHGETQTHRLFARGNFIWSQSLAWSPDSRWLAFLALDARFFSNVYVQAINEDLPRQITFLSNVLGYDLLWSPDGQFLIFTSGQYREELQIVRVDLRPAEPLFRESEFEKLFDDEAERKNGRAQPAAPPEPEATDDKQAAAEPATAADLSATDDETTEALPAEPATDETSTEAAQPATESAEASTEPAPDEKRIEIAFEGIERRLRFLTPIQMDAAAEAISPDSRDLLFLATIAGKVNIWSLPLDEPRQDNPMRQLTSNSAGKHSVQFAPDGKTFYYLEDGQVTVRKFPSGNDPNTLRLRGEAEVDFHLEKQQIFNEAWRVLRDAFYDATFGGHDWQALREQFAPLIAGVQTSGDLTAIINLMLGELATSHTGTYWSSNWTSDDAYLGLLFDPHEQLTRGALRIAAIVPDSPVTRVTEPPRVGEYLVAVNNEPLTTTTSLEALLQRMVGRRVWLRLASSPETAENGTTRQVAVRPIDNDAYAVLRYRQWVNINKAYVHRISNGRLGYVHVEEMSYTAYQQFLVDLDTETHGREGIVLDVRYNGGGHIATFILDVLMRRNVLHTAFRDVLTTNPYHLSGNRVLHKPTILVTNEGSASNTEIFTEIYRRLGLGKVVGKPTAGQVIGTVSWTLLNGSYVRLPMYSYTTPEGENLEGTGRHVDIEIDQPVGAWGQGRDYQLDAAVATLLQDIENTKGSASTD